MYYHMPKHGIDLVCIRRTPMSVLGTAGSRSVLRTSSGFASDVITQILHGEHSHGLNLTKSYIRKMMFLPFRLQILSAAYLAIFFFCTIYQNTIACDLSPHFFLQKLSNFSKRQGGRLVPSGRLRHVPLRGTVNPGYIGKVLNVCVLRAHSQ